MLLNREFHVKNGEVLTGISNLGRQVVRIVFSCCNCGNCVVSEYMTVPKFLGKRYGDSDPVISSAIGCSDKSCGNQYLAKVKSGPTDVRAEVWQISSSTTDNAKPENLKIEVASSFENWNDFRDILAPIEISHFTLQAQIQDSYRLVEKLEEMGDQDALKVLLKMSYVHAITLLESFVIELILLLLSLEGFRVRFLDNWKDIGYEETERLRDLDPGELEHALSKKVEGGHFTSLYKIIGTLNAGLESPVLISSNPILVNAKDILKKAVEIRNDIAHRNGKPKGKEQEHELTPSNVKGLLDKVEILAAFLDESMTENFPHLRWNSDAESHKLEGE